MEDFEHSRCGARAYITAVRELLGLLEEDPAAALPLCEPALRHLEQLRVQQPEWDAAGDGCVGADWVWFAVELAQLQLRTSKADAVKQIQVVLDSLKPAPHPHLAGYCHYSIARVLVAKADAASVLDAADHLHAALALAQESTEYIAPGLSPGKFSTYQVGPQLALKGLCLLARLQHDVAEYCLGGINPQQGAEGIHAAAKAATDACSTAFGHSSKEVQKVM